MNVVADKSEPLTAVHRPWRNFRFVGIEPLELADHLIDRQDVVKRCQSILFAAAISPG